MKALDVSSNDQNNTGNLVALNSWLTSLGIQRITAWRWCKRYGLKSWLVLLFTTFDCQDAHAGFNGNLDETIHTICTAVRMVCGGLEEILLSLLMFFGAVIIIAWVGERLIKEAVTRYARIMAILRKNKPRKTSRSTKERRKRRRSKRPKKSG